MNGSSGRGRVAPTSMSHGRERGAEESHPAPVTGEPSAVVPPAVRDILRAPELTESLLASVVARTSDGVVLLSTAGEVLWWNPAMERISGRGAAEAMGRPWDHVFEAQEPESRPAWHPVRDVEGRVRAHVVVIRDPTSNESANQTTQEFVATVSHELRSPLTPLKGFLATLLSGTADDSAESRHEYYRIMQKQTERLENLTANLLEVARIESGHGPLESRAVELASLVQEQVREFSLQFPEPRVRVRIPLRPVTALADSVRVAHILSNLISNALKYSPAGAPVDVTVGVDGDRAVVSVTDRGDGIPAAEQDRVFDRFYRVDTGLTRRTGGTGLGLYIARRLAEEMGGHLWVRSRPGVGSTFSFSLPLEDAGASGGDRIFGRGDSTG